MTINFIKKYRKLSYFIFSFYFSMGISSYIQILYFQSNGRLNLFSLYYSTMAVAGACSFLVSNQLVEYSINSLSKVFITVYSIGLFLRIFVNNPLLVILSAIMCGISASIVLLLLRRWIYLITDNHIEERGKIHSTRFFFMQLAGIFSSAVAGMIFNIFTNFSDNNTSYVSILIISALMMFTNGFIHLPNINENETKASRFTVFPKQNKRLGALMYVIYIFLGISVAIVSSILPAIIRDFGWSVGETSLIVSILTFLTLCFSYIYQLKWITKNANRVFLFTQIISAIVCILSLCFSQRSISVLVIGLVTEVTLAGFFILKELLEYEIIPNSERSIFLGLIQSSFLIGDSLGSPIGSYIYTSKGLSWLIIIYSLIVICSSIAFSALIRLSRH